MTERPTAIRTRPLAILARRPLLHHVHGDSRQALSLKIPTAKLVNLYEQVGACPSRSAAHEPAPRRAPRRAPAC